MKFISNFIFIALTVTLTSKSFASDPCDDFLNEPQVIQELRQLKLNVLSSKDRSEFLILNDAFETKLIDIAKKLKISPKDLLKKIEDSNQQEDSNASIATAQPVSDAEAIESLLEMFKQDPNYIINYNGAKYWLIVMQESRNKGKPFEIPSTYANSEQRISQYILAYLLESQRAGGFLRWFFKVVF